VVVVKYFFAKQGVAMPVYDYQCNNCKFSFEIRATIQEKEAGLHPVCPKCQSPETRQVLSAGIFIFGGNKNNSSNPSSCCGPNSGSGCCG
jgi:putative FmdB family regulatory protein